MKINLKKIANHWYPCIPHEAGYLVGFDRKIDKYLSIKDISKTEELTIEFEELGIIWGGLNIIYFNEEDIVRYLTTDDNFNLRFIINEHEFTISSDLYFMLESVYNFNFHKSSYKIHIY